MIDQVIYWLHPSGIVGIKHSRIKATIHIKMAHTSVEHGDNFSGEREAKTSPEVVSELATNHNDFMVKSVPMKGQVILI